MRAIMFPGQGAQRKGMGKDLFRIYQNDTLKASEILGFDIEELCVNDTQKQLGQTQFTQPALYVVNALTYKDKYKEKVPDYLAGHSLGEYNALLAAGVFDFETGLRLVKKRGELMAAASGGGMAAVIELSAVSLRERLADGGYLDIDVANYNTPTQTVISGPKESINKVIDSFGNLGIHVIPLLVSAPFHSRYMQSAATEFASFLADFTFLPLQIPVIANSTARIYENEQIALTLSEQIRNPVQWTDSIRLLMGCGVTDFSEVGSHILEKMVKEIVGSSSPIIQQKAEQVKEGVSLAMRLGSRAFREDHGMKYAYVAGAMYRGIASKELVVLMGKAGMLGFLGTGGLNLEEVEQSIRFIQQELKNGEAYGLNLLHNIVYPELEMKSVELYLKYGVKKVEASAFMQITPALVYYRLKGIRKDEQGKVRVEHKIIAKISRPEVAELFMMPAPDKLVRKLVEQGLLTSAQAELAKYIPMCDDICVEADSGGHTDGGVALVLLPAIQSLRTETEEKYNYQQSVRIGLAGGIGTPQAVACAFIMGADFVLTGSINQCTVAAGTSDAVKDLLQDINVQDTDYAPAGDMFEIGAKVQVLKKGVLFPARANKLFVLYNQYNSLEELPEKTVLQLERDYFKKSIDDVFKEVKRYFEKTGKQTEIVKAESNGKYKMALVFRYYFSHTSKLSFKGELQEKVNFQVHTGPALGAFNQWVKGTPLENWRNRHADEIGVKMMQEAAQLLSERLTTLVS